MLLPFGAFLNPLPKQSFLRVGQFLMSREGRHPPSRVWIRNSFVQQALLSFSRNDWNPVGALREDAFFGIQAEAHHPR
jgi:hypothetical protein